MASVDLTFLLKMADNDSVQAGSVDPVTISLNSALVYHVEDVTVADNFGTATLWTSPNGGVTTFSVGLIISNQDIFVEFRNDDASTPEYSIQKIPANFPFFFAGKNGGATAARLDGLVLVDNTDYADIDRIKVGRDVANDVGDATVSLYLFA